jgi:uncharacterized protein YprB with RNaseH-like and TPR domain
MNKKWSVEEENKLRENYPFLGYKVLSLFPDRSKPSVIRHADWMNLKFDKKARKESKVDKVGYLDIESTGLTGNFGWLISWCIKEQDSKKILSAHVTREEILDGTLDKRIVQELVETMKQFTLIITYYGARFDIPMVRTRAIFWEIPFIPYGEIEHKDLYFLARSRLRLHSNRLDSVCDLMGISGKTHLEPRIWVSANTGNEESIKYIVEHNRWDVIILEEVHRKLGEFASTTARSFL